MVNLIKIQQINKTRKKKNTLGIKKLIDDLEQKVLFISWSPVVTISKRISDMQSNIHMLLI